jgi:hypothetical protein
MRIKRRNRKPTLFEGLREALQNGEAVRIVRTPKRKLPHWEGFVVELSDRLVLLHDLDVDHFALNGYKCFRLKDISAGEAIGASDQFVGRAVLLRGLEGVTPEDLDLEDLGAVLRSAGERYPLITVHLENDRPEICYVGRVLKVGRRRVTLRLINPDASWDKVWKFSLDDITRIDFDGGYERMLFQVNQAYHNNLLAHTPGVGTA